MDTSILEIRHALEKCVEEKLTGNLHGAGTNLETGETDFSFDFDGVNYSVHIKELKTALIGELG
ncbi:hypothetical protein LCGC14_2369210 [marine sediment metagenome]|uniref:Uncharacterized protein n=1 Tax=marine sediment metagenome TaxID=412755 RepID=A0A0F9EYY9_9ZZZZ